MTYSEMIEPQNDPRRSPMGPWGPLGGQQQVFRITVASKTPRYSPRAVHLGSSSRSASAAIRRRGESAADALVRQRQERHRRDAGHDRVVRQLRDLAEERAAFRERLERHRQDAEVDRVRWRLRRLR